MGSRGLSEPHLHTCLKGWLECLDTHSTPSFMLGLFMGWSEVSVLREWEKSCKRSWVPALELALCHFCHILGSQQVTDFPKLRNVCEVRLQRGTCKKQGSPRGHLCKPSALTCPLASVTHASPARGTPLPRSLRVSPDHGIRPDIHSPCPVSGTDAEERIPGVALWMWALVIQEHKDLRRFTYSQTQF